MWCSLVHVEVSSSVFRKPPVDATKSFELQEVSGNGCRVTGSIQLDKVSKVHIITLLSNYIATPSRMRLLLVDYIVTT